MSHSGIEIAIKKSSSKEEIIAAIQACAAKLGHVPSQAELKEQIGVGPKFFQRQFGNYTKALEASGLEGRGSGFMLSLSELFHEWARIVRLMGEIPSLTEYMVQSKHSATPLRKRFRTWWNVPAGMVQYAETHGLEEQWKDVLEIAKRERRRGATGGWRSKPEPVGLIAPAVFKDRPLYGPPLMNPALAFAPVNEMGVVYLFGVMAQQLGFMVTWMGTAYPDCEAIREVEPGRWQRVRIEFEFQSRNFMQHFHNPEECDLIVCWEHNWAESPLEVVELRKKIG
jgi:Homing endonuclease associated repeat